LLVSGGDDSALYAAQFTLKLDSNDITKVHVIREITEPAAHTSSVTGNNTCMPRESTLALYISWGIWVDPFTLQHCFDK